MRALRWTAESTSDLALCWLHTGVRMQCAVLPRVLLCAVGLLVLGAVFAAGRWSAGSAPALLTTAVLSGATGKLYQARRLREHPGVRRFSRALPQPRPYPAPMHHNESCVRWCVFTTINPPTAPVTQCASLRGWCVVVVGDKKSPAAYKVPKGAGKIVYLDPVAQQALPYRLLRLLPWNHFGRKNLGYVTLAQTRTRTRTRTLTLTLTLTLTRSMRSTAAPRSSWTSTTTTSCSRAQS